ncbi:uroporphyrinogen-III synthase [Saccharibacter floricola]|uniref:Uroporphyrinogen-III synthase n=1 Tax=Saccharibacter floricola DSM 15669 TaxID=1123227 RepID=A0ABQ0P1J2_9PROT|nr:uroporphyrinogen-III synthase [Saccharibacter floricola]GBQ06262.1 uroporphyrinogen-III synthase [Saccharibacter floricola DSM 15669]
MNKAPSRMVVVTRPEPGLSDTLARLREGGWRAVSCPVMVIQPVAPLPFIEGDALVITSAQALPALAEQPKERLLLTVGKQTADRARKAGFTQVKAAQGKREGLVALCRAYGVSGERVSFVCGCGWRGQAYSRAVADQLGARWVKGYQVQRTSCLAKEAVQALSERDVEAICFYSVETVRAFLSLCPASLTAALRSVRAVCLSEAIAAEARDIVWREVCFGDPVAVLGSP